MTSAPNPMHELLWSGVVGLWELVYELIGLYQRFPGLIYPTLWLAAGALGAVIYYVVIGCAYRDNCGRNQTPLVVFGGPLSLPFVLAGVWLACRKMEAPETPPVIQAEPEVVTPEEFRRAGGC